MLLSDGAIYMQNRLIIITGAGFSAPAKLPVQNQIIRKMTEKSSDFMASEIEQESNRFINAYIKVGLFLLDNYVKTDYSAIKTEYESTCKKNNDSHTIETIIDSMAKNKVIIEKEFILEINKYIVSDYDYYKQISLIRERIRDALSIESLDVNLEDIFTSFDKSMQSKEYIHRYSYHDMDDIRSSIMRLFVYYFMRSSKEHKYLDDSYLNFISFIKKNHGAISIITTNWDNVLENYCLKTETKFNLGLQHDYFVFDGNRDSKHNRNSENLLIKIHGSINWFRCMNCNTLSIKEKDDPSKFLFDDHSKEKCERCQSEANDNTPLLQPEIITPTMLKSINNQLYNNLWGAAKAELMLAVKVIFLGYSLPIADYEFRYLLQKCIPDVAKIDVVLFKNDNPMQTDKKNLKDLLPEKRYRDLFSKNDIEFFYEGFGEYFKNN